MKKIITLLAIAGLFVLQSCTTSGSFEIAPYCEKWSFLKSQLRFNSSNNYGRLVTFNPPIYSSDVVLVYRLAGSNSQGDVWELYLKPIILVMEQWILAINLIIVRCRRIYDR
jgi:hypothetical protein